MFVCAPKFRTRLIVERRIINDNTDILFEQALPQTLSQPSDSVDDLLNDQFNSKMTQIIQGNMVTGCKNCSEIVSGLGQVWAYVPEQAQLKGSAQGMC